MAPLRFAGGASTLWSGAETAEGSSDERGAVGIAQAKFRNKKRGTWVPQAIVPRTRWVNGYGEENSVERPGFNFQQGN